MARPWAWARCREQRDLVEAGARLDGIHPGEEARERDVRHGRGGVGVVEGDDLAGPDPRAEARHQVRIEGVDVEALVDEQQDVEARRGPRRRGCPGEGPAQAAFADATGPHLRGHHQQGAVRWLEAGGGDLSVEGREEQGGSSQAPATAPGLDRAQAPERRGAEEGRTQEGGAHAEAEPLLEEDPGVAQLRAGEFHCPVVGVGALEMAVARGEAEPQAPRRPEGHERAGTPGQRREDPGFPEQPAHQGPGQEPEPLLGEARRAQQQQERRVHGPVQRQPADERPGHGGVRPSAPAGPGGPGCARGGGRPRRGWRRRCRSSRRGRRWSRGR